MRVLKGNLVSAITLTMLLASVSTLAFNTRPVEAGGTVGVKAGDWIKCTYTVSGWPSGTPYPEWLEVEFLSVDGTNATIRVTMRMSDGTESNQTMTVDVAAGGGTFQGLSGFVIPANCTTGDSVYMSGYGNVTIAGETIGTYAGATRTVVYTSFSQYGTQLTYHWDKLTGVMVEASVVSGGVTGTAEATETNMWQAEIIYIRADGSIDPPIAPISTFDNVTYTLTGNITSDAHGIVVLRSNITIDGAGYTLQCMGALSTGIYVESGSNVTIKNAKIKDFDSGLSFFGNTPALKFNRVLGNDIVNNTRGIMGGGFSYNISGNNIINNTWGVELFASSNNTIDGNNIIANDHGITLWDESSNNSIFGNSIDSNIYGISLVYGSSDNQIFHNNFINNAMQADSWGYNNTWDDGYPSGGNYWSDYNGYDSDHDGIGDTPYFIDENNTDHYPLMGRFSDFSATSEHHVQTVCNSSISSFQYNGTAISYNVSGENDTAGFCRICIPTPLMNATYKVFVNGTEVLYNLLPCSNETYSYLYFNYTHSTEQVIIIPEFSSFLIPSLFMIATLLAVIVYKRKHAKISGTL